MRQPRSRLIDRTVTGCYHVISRCVRKAYLCGDRYEHRRTWAEELIELCARNFGIQVLAYAVMENHLHLVLKNRPDLVASWSDEEITRRWFELYPQTMDDELREQLIVAHANRESWVEERRDRLADISWFMRIIKERIARRANREDDCVGAFWESRFKSVRLLDPAAVVACMVYNDLNPVRAGLVDRPEAAVHTSFHRRITEYHRRAVEGDQSPDTWLAPLTEAWPGTTDAPDAPIPLSSDTYLHLVDVTGRLVRRGKPGRIPPSLSPILDRLGMAVPNWVSCMRRTGTMVGTAIGSVGKRAAEAKRRGLRWLRDHSGLFLERTAPT